jgi:hypothetical protein
LRITTAVRLGSARRENTVVEIDHYDMRAGVCAREAGFGQKAAFRKLVCRFVSVNGTLRECRLVDDHGGNQGSSRPRLNIGRKFMRPHFACPALLLSSNGWRKIDLTCSISG